jgi:tRNA1(Val) A37 N6-methylase TrmN6
MSLDHASKIVKHQTLTRDAFLGGRLIVSQPRNGFRAGMDSVLLGAAVGEKSQSLLDLGAGPGTAALVALVPESGAFRHPRRSRPRMPPRSPPSIFPETAWTSRGIVLTVDVTAPGKIRAAAGLPADHFSAVIANPPYFEAGRAPRPPARAAARHMHAPDLDRWVKTAATHAAPGGEVIFIYPAHHLPTLLGAFDARFGAISHLAPVAARGRTGDARPRSRHQGLPRAPDAARHPRPP